MIDKSILESLCVTPGKPFRLKSYETGWALSDDLKEAGKDLVKERAKKILKETRADLAEAQQLLYADGRFAVLVVFQAMDAAGKDSTIKHVMSGVNPQGCEVYSFKKPSTEELAHDFLWRCAQRVPERGRIGIFNRSYYEDVLIARVHPELLDLQRLPPGKRGKAFWKERYEAINNFEHHLTRNGTVIVKFFLNVSKKEQKKRFLERLDRPEKNWKFSIADLAERGHWDEYMSAYENALSATSTEWAPWHVIPADDKWATHTLVADILTTTIRSLDLHYPKISPDQTAELAAAREQLEQE